LLLAGQVAGHGEAARPLLLPVLAGEDSRPLLPQDAARVYKKYILCYAIGSAGPRFTSYYRIAAANLFNKFQVYTLIQNFRFFIIFWSIHCYGILLDSSANWNNHVLLISYGNISSFSLRSEALLACFDVVL
jgi:hypothetical protein